MRLLFPTVRTGSKKRDDESRRNKTRQHETKKTECGRISMCRQMRNASGAVEPAVMRNETRGVARRMNKIAATPFICFFPTDRVFECRGYCVDALSAVSWPFAVCAGPVHVRALATSSRVARETLDARAACIRIISIDIVLSCNTHTNSLS